MNILFSTLQNIHKPLLPLLIDQSHLLHIPILDSTIVPGQHRSQYSCQNRRRGHETSTNGHSTYIVRLVMVRIEPRANQRTTLANDIQERNSRTAFRGAVLIVERPSDDEGDGGKETDRGGKDAQIAVEGWEVEITSNREEQVTNRGKQGVENQERCSKSRAVGKVGGEDDGKE